MSSLRITKIEVHEFTFPMNDVGKDYNGFNLVYEKGGQQTGYAYAMKVHTNEGVTGEYVGGDSPSFAEFNMFAKYLIGKDPLQREPRLPQEGRRLEVVTGFPVHFVPV